MDLWDSYNADYAKQTHSGGMELTGDLKRKNLLFYERVRDELPAYDRYMLSDCDLLYRMLIARDSNLDEATKLFRKYVKERQQCQMNTILTRTFTSELEAAAMSLYGYSRDNLPILWFKPDPSILLQLLKKKVPMETILSLQMRGIESVRFLAKHRGVDRCFLVVDMQKVTVSCVRKSIITFIAELFRRQQELYPEVFQHILVFESGWAVESGWKLVRPFVKRAIQQKVRFQRGAVSPAALAEWVAGADVHPMYGGTGEADPVAALLEEERQRLAREAEGEEGEEEAKEAKTKAKAKLSGDRPGDFMHTVEEKSALAVASGGSTVPSVRQCV